MLPFKDQCRHRLVAHYLDGRLKKGITHKLDPDAPGFFLTPADLLSREKEIYIAFSNLKAVFYVKKFEGGRSLPESREKYIPRGQEVTIRFTDGETLKGLALNYNDESPRFVIGIPDSSDNNYGVLVERARAASIAVGKVFRKN